MMKALLRPAWLAWKGRVALAIGLILMLLVAHARFRLALVDGESMLPGFCTGDVLLVDRRAYRTVDPRRGDIVLAWKGKDFIVKRVVGLPGEQVELRSGHMFVNGLAIVEDYALQSGYLDISSGKLFAGRFALLGDNRAVAPAQLIGPVVPRDRILGRVVSSLRLGRLLASRGVEPAT